MKTIILGAGASGLGAAWGLVEAGRTNIIVVEKNAVVGGLSGSFKSGDVTVDYGPHRFSPEYPELVDKFRKLLGKDFLEVPNEHAVVFQGRTYRYPPVLADFLNFQTVKICTQVLTSFFWTRVKTLFRTKNPSGFEETVINSFGPQFYALVIKPICLKVWGDPSRLDPDFARLRFSIPSFSRVLKKLMSQGDVNDKIFYYSRYGFQQFWDVLADYLRSKGVEIRLNATASKINVENNRATSVTIGESTIAADWVISTIPTQHFTRLLQPGQFSPTDILSQKFLNRGILLVLMVINKEKVLPARVIIAPELKYCFNRLSEQNQFSRDTVPAGKSAVLADIICDVGGEMWSRSDEDIKRQVIRDVVSCGYFAESDLDRTEIFRIPVAYPLPTIERESAQKNFNKIIMQLENVICTGRFASSDYNNSHTALKKGLLTAKPITENMSLSDWYSEVEPIRKAAIRD
jgi:protoporphyrinogen oxidase